MDNLQVLSLHSNRLRAIPDLRRLHSLKVGRQRSLPGEDEQTFPLSPGVGY